MSFGSVMPSKKMSSMVGFDDPTEDHHPAVRVRPAVVADNSASAVEMIDGQMHASYRQVSHSGWKLRSTPKSPIAFTLE